MNDFPKQVWCDPTKYRRYVSTPKDMDVDRLFAKPEEVAAIERLYWRDLTSQKWVETVPRTGWVHVVFPKEFQE